MVVNVGQIGTSGPKLGPRIQPHDGKLDVIVATSASLLGALRILFRIMTGRFEGGGDLHYLQVEHITITARPSLPTEIDGESLGTTPLRVEAVRDGALLLVPADYQPGGTSTAS